MYINKLVSVFSIALASFTTINAQEPVKISNGDNTIEFGATFGTYYQYREYSPGYAKTKMDKNTFKVKDARFDFNGKYGEDYEFHLQIDVAALGTADPAAPPVYDANFTYKGFKKSIGSIIIGWDKLPYSYSSLVEHEWSPFWERPVITKGDFFSRRDVGIRLERSFLKNKMKYYAEVCTGTGENALGNMNDPSGALEMVGRLEYSYPEKRKKEFLDTKVSQTPFFTIGANARYSNRRLPAGTVFLPGEKGALLDDSTRDFKVINGEKLLYGFDVCAMYKGFSAQFEIHQLKGTPQNANDPLLYIPVTNKYATNFYAGGYYAQVNYFSKKLQSSFSVRYDELNASDLVTGVSKHLALAFTHMLKGYHSMIKAEFYRNLDQTETTIIKSSWQNEYRIGWQFFIQ